MQSDGLGELLTSAENGSAEAQNALGVRLITGDGCPVDGIGGFYWYCQAIKGGYVESMWNAGSMLVDGDGGITKDLEVGMKLVEIAAGANQSGACRFLAACYRNGTYGKPRDDALVQYWDEKAWDYKNIRVFAEGIDLEKQYGLQIIVPKTR